MANGNAAQSISDALKSPALWVLINPCFRRNVAALPGINAGVDEALQSGIVRTEAAQTTEYPARILPVAGHAFHEGKIETCGHLAWIVLDYAL